MANFCFGVMPPRAMFVRSWFQVHRRRIVIRAIELQPFAQCGAVPVGCSDLSATCVKSVSHPDASKIDSPILAFTSRLHNRTVRGISCLLLLFGKARKSLIYVLFVHRNKLQFCIRKRFFWITAPNNPAWIDIAFNALGFWLKYFKVWKMRPSLPHYSTNWR